MRSQRTHLPLDNAKLSARLAQCIQFSQHKRMSNTENPGETAAVAGGPELGRNDQRRLHRCQPCVFRLFFLDKRKELLGTIHAFVHVASRLRKETMIDFEVGVSLSSPALPSGTRTFSSG